MIVCVPEFHTLGPAQARLHISALIVSRLLVKDFWSRLQSADRHSPRDLQGPHSPFPLTHNDMKHFGLTHARDQTCILKADSPFLSSGPIYQTGPDKGQYLSSQITRTPLVKVFQRSVWLSWLWHVTHTSKQSHKTALKITLKLVCVFMMDKVSCCSTALRAHW